MSIPKLQGVHPVLAQKVTKLLVAMFDLGHAMVITDGVRTLAQQQAAYAKGRTVKGEPPYLDDQPLGRTVTKANGIPKEQGGTGVSNHQVRADGYGHACDLVFLVNGKPSWDDSLPWDLYGHIAESLGLEWGGRWPSRDRPHIELP